ncbi:ribosomal-processing cysteine protease Prp [bacterium]|nr:ribosomal-processing cysteine protease Prp [bacterium]
MIKVSCSSQSIKISGHAFAGSPGNDLVCAAVSAIVIGSIHTLESFSPQEITIQNGQVIININHQLTYEDKIRLNMLITMIKTIAAQYPQNIFIEKMYNLI